MTDTRSQTTTRVRIAVAVNQKGEWSAYGLCTNNDSQNKTLVWIDDMETGEVYHFIEADVPLPVSQTIEGQVVT